MNQLILIFIATILSLNYSMDIVFLYNHDLMRQNGDINNNNNQIRSFLIELINNASSEQFGICVLITFNSNYYQLLTLKETKNKNKSTKINLINNKIDFYNNNNLINDGDYNMVKLDDVLDEFKDAQKALFIFYPTTNDDDDRKTFCKNYQNEYIINMDGDYIYDCRGDIYFNNTDLNKIIFNKSDIINSFNLNVNHKNVLLPSSTIIIKHNINNKISYKIGNILLATSDVPLFKVINVQEMDKKNGDNNDDQQITLKLNVIDININKSPIYFKKRLSFLWISSISNQFGAAFEIDINQTGLR